MPQTTLRFAGGLYTATFLEKAIMEANAFDRVIGETFALLTERVAEFGFDQNVVAVYPALDAGSDFLRDPRAYIDAHIAALARFGRRARETVILTTFGPTLAAALRPCGFGAQSARLPAAPDGTLILRRAEAGDGPTLYIEAVDDADPRIAPNFALTVRDGERLVAAAAGTIGVSAGERAAWIGAFVTRADAPPGLGSALYALLEKHLAQRGVARVDLGTQTAPRFYERLGFETLRVVVEGLRVRRGPDGRRVSAGLVMLSKRIAPPGGKPDGA